MPDEMRPVFEERGNVVGIAVEVHAAVRRTLSEPPAIHQQEAIGGGERPLLEPRRFAPAEASVNEDSRLAFAPDRHVQPARAPHAATLPPVQAVAAISYGSSGSKTAGCRRKAEKNASTTSGENCVPRHRRTSAAASSRVNAGRYGRSVVIASHASASPTTQASAGISSPARLSGYPLPSQRSW